MEKNYTFERVDKVVKISPMSTLFCKRIMDRFRKEMKSNILPNNCYMNAILAAAWLRERGFDIEIVEGEMIRNEQAEKIAKRCGMVFESKKHQRLNEAPTEHRFLRKNGKYFDPTLEIIASQGFSDAFDYKAIRVYSYEDISDFTYTTFEDYGELHFHNSISGLTYVYKGEEDIPLKWSYINEEGNIVKPNYNPFEKRAEILAA